METLFGLSTDALTRFLAVLFLVGAAVTAFLALRNRVMFKMAVRNIPRRRAQTILIVLGLMLATLLFSASFATGDTLAHSIRVQALDRIGLVDVTVALDEREESGRAAYFDVSVAERVREALADAPVDGVMVAAQERVVAVAADTGRSDTGVDAFGFDPAQMEGFDPLAASDGATLDVGALRPGQVYISAELADDLDAGTGGLIDLYFSETPTRVEAVGVYESGANPGSADSVVFALSDLQRILGREGQARWVYVSNDGGLVDGAEHTDAVLEALKDVEEELGLSVTPLKRDALEQADEVGASVASIFLVFGNFSIIAGILLIFLIFVMLAAERKRELGIARAIGAQQSHVVRLFTFEGAFYALMASAVGSVLGVVVGLGIVRVIASALTTFDLTITFSVRWQSMLLAFCLGMAATFLVVIVSAVRVSALNIVRAVRDIPEPPSQPPSLRELARAPLRRFTRGLGDLVLRRRIGGLAAMTMGTLMAAFRLAWGLMLAGWGAVALGILLTMAGFGSKQLGTFMLGTSLVLIGAPLALRHSFRLPDRPAYTIAGLALVGWWLVPFEWLEPLLGGEFNVTFDLFITSGVMMVLGAVWTVMYNSDLLTRALLAVFGRNRTLAPVMRTSIAYPMASRFRTGMTLAMFSIVVFTLVVTGFITSAFAYAFEDTRRFSGGFDLSADVNFNNPIPDLRAALAQTDGVDAANIAAIGSITGLPTKVRQVGVIEEPKEPEDWFLSGVDAEYAQSVTYGFQLKADGYETDEMVWEALASGEDVIAVSPFLVPTRDAFGDGGPQGGFRFEGFYPDDETLPEVYVEAFDFAANESRLLRVIAILEDDALLARTMITSRGVLQELAPVPLPVLSYFFVLRDPAQAPDMADAMEGAFVENGLQATALAEAIREQTELNLTFNRLLQGFMGLGLVVGIAALGVIAARSVVERRQQIGMLRAIGFQRNMVQTSFLLESSFIALLGIAVGIALAAGLAVGIISSIASDFGGVRYVVPWFTIGIVVVVAYGASLLTTYAPARQAANIYPAEALRIAE